MKLKYQFYLQQIGTTWLGVTVGESAKHYDNILKLNEIGHDIVEMLADDIDRDTIVNNILNMYDATRQDAEQAVDDMLAHLKNMEAIEE